ncbi:hypothetical protein C8J57DRAFT_1516552 [Mycena rebaudengoi]|nr:hypothetical protein C8J57DRAFT_1516552 [Mycena rebaudengoi]
MRRSLQHPRPHLLRTRRLREPSAMSSAGHAALLAPRVRGSTPRKACPVRACWAAMLVLVSRTELDDGEARTIWQSSVRFANYDAMCVRNAGQVLVEWVAKIEGRESLLEHAA